jgi:GH24 family phage-related lysozyme (muramidase)
MGGMDISQNLRRAAAVRLGDVKLFQHEYDAYLSLDANTGGVCASSIPGKLKAGQYEDACKTILDFNGFCTQNGQGNAESKGKTILDFNGFCTQPKITNAAGKKVCPPGARKALPGLVKRREAEYRLCAEGGYP